MCERVRVRECTRNRETAASLSASAFNLRREFWSESVCVLSGLYSFGFLQFRVSTVSGFYSFGFLQYRVCKVSGSAVEQIAMDQTARTRIES